jgi:hypothetical protein
MYGHINGEYTSPVPCRHIHLKQNIQRAQTCTVARSSWSEGQGCLELLFVPSHFFYVL